MTSQNIKLEPATETSIEQSYDDHEYNELNRKISELTRLTKYKDAKINKYKNKMEHMKEQILHLERCNDCYDTMISLLQLTNDIANSKWLCDDKKK